MIIALSIVSMSELAFIKPDITYQWVDENRNDFLDMLYSMGMDVKQTIEQQDDLQHRNRMGQIVICTRWVGYERTDKAWIDSGYASREARDKASGSKLIEDIYRTRGLVE